MREKLLMEFIGTMGHHPQAQNIRGYEPMGELEIQVQETMLIRFEAIREIER